MQIAIDGPVAAGKGTVAYLLAKKLGILYIDTGAMYRAVALISIKNNISLENEKDILKLLKKTKIELKMPRSVYVNGIDVSNEIRTPQISQGSSKVAVLPRIRKYLVDLQKKIADDKSVVMEGRDITTVVMPNADLKIYLTATPEVRAKRRLLQLKEQSIEKSFEEILKETLERDKRDSTRKTDPLTITKDSWVLDTTNLTIDQVVDKILKKINAK